MQVIPSLQKQPEAAIAEEIQLKTTVTSINRGGFNQHTQSSIYDDEYEERCFVLSSN